MSTDQKIRRRPARIALLLRAYINSPKTHHLAHQLASVQGADLFICADTTRNSVQISNFPHIEYSLDRLDSLGLRTDVEGGRDKCLWFCGDYAGYPALVDIPEYDYYVMVEYDIYFSSRGLMWLQAICEWLQGWPESRFDCFAPKIILDAPPKWHWHPHAQRVGGFETVSMFLFSMFIISKSASAYLYSMRLLEASRAQARIDSEQDKSGAVSFCEYFVPSSLRRNPEFRLMQLKDLTGGLSDIQLTHFTSNRPICVDYETNALDVGDMAHPVLDVEQYVRKLVSMFYGDRSPFPQTKWILENAEHAPVSARQIDEYNSLIEQARQRIYHSRAMTSLIK